MSVPSLCVVLAAAGLLFALPRRWCILPFLIVAGYIPFGQVMEIGPVHFTGLRVLIAVGILRVLSKGEHLAGGINALDKLMWLWGAWFACASMFHESDALVTRLGEVFTDLGIYFLCRIFLQDMGDIVHAFKIVCVAFAPLAALLLLESMTDGTSLG